MKQVAPALLLALAACTPPKSGPTNATEEGPGGATTADARLPDELPFDIERMGSFDEPWAADFMPGTPLLFVTEKGGTIKFVDTKTGRVGSVQSGVPEVSYGGQGGLGDIAFSPTANVENPSRLYLTWVEGGPNGTRGAVLGRGSILCQEADACELSDVQLLWRQDKVTGGGHFSHRIAFSPDGRYIFLTSGDRQKMEPAQDLNTNLGKVLRLTLEGKPAPGNPFADKGSPADQIWSYGHRNLLGIEFAPDGNLWQIEMGPRHGDELNLVLKGRNYGWPNASMGDHYSGKSIPDHRPGDGYEAPKAWWVPATSPGSFLVYDGDLFKGLKGDAIVAGLSGEELTIVDIEGDEVRAKRRYPMGARIREIVEGPDGTIYAFEDKSGDLLKLTPKS